MQKKLKLIVFSLIGFILIGLSLSTCYFVFLKEAKPKEGVYISSAAKMVSMTREERLEWRKRWAKDQFKFLSEVEASKYLAFELKLPKSPNAGKLIGIYVSKDDDLKARTANIFYNDLADGIEILAELLPEKLNCEEWLLQEKEWMIQQEKDIRAGVSKADKSPVLMFVNGFEGLGAEPGYNIIRGEKYPRPGFITWCDDGVTYRIFGTRGESGTSLEILIEIAESMYQ